MTPLPAGALRDAGLDHVQLSVQDAEEGSADRIGGMRGGHARKLLAGRMVTAAGLPLTLNAVVHRRNLERLPELIANGKLCSDLGLPQLDPAQDRAMICGGPAMLKDMRGVLDTAGFAISPGIGQPGGYVIERAFVEK